MPQINQKSTPAATEEERVRYVVLAANVFDYDRFMEQIHDNIKQGTFGVDQKQWAAADSLYVYVQDHAEKLEIKTGDDEKLFAQVESTINARPEHEYRLRTSDDFLEAAGTLLFTDVTPDMLRAMGFNDEQQQLIADKKFLELSDNLKAVEQANISPEQKNIRDQNAQIIANTTRYEDWKSQTIDAANETSLSGEHKAELDRVIRIGNSARQKMLDVTLSHIQEHPNTKPKDTDAEKILGQYRKSHPDFEALNVKGVMELLLHNVDTALIKPHLSASEAASLDRGKLEELAVSIHASSGQGRTSLVERHLEQRSRQGSGLSLN